MSATESRKAASEKWHSAHRKIGADRSKKHREDNLDHYKEVGKLYYLNNKIELNEKGKQRYQDNINNDPEYCRRLWFKKQYGLSLDDLLDMVNNQNNKCAICDVEFNPNTKALKPHVDHNHSTGKVRQLLCHHCNVAVGHLKEDIETAKKLIKYLERHNETNI